MKKTIVTGLGATIALLTAVSCSDFAEQYGSGKGRISPAIGIDTESVGDSAPGSRAEYYDVQASDLSITLAKKDGSYKHTWDALGDFPVDQDFTVGDYTMDAFYGDPKNEGFEKPAFFGTTDFTVADGRTTSLALTAQMANAMFRVKYTEAFQKYMKSWSATFVTANGSHEYAADQTKPLYVAPGEVTLKVTVEKPNGLGDTFEVAKLTAEARYDYTVTVDVNNGNVGDATLDITFSENLAVETVKIDISDKILSSAAPAVTADGFVPGEKISTVAGTVIDPAPEFNIVAMGGLAEVLLHTESSSLIARGWPADINLLAATPEQQQAMKALGFESLGLFRQPDQMAVINLAKVPVYILPAAGDNDNTFTVTVKDKLSRVSEPLSLTIYVEDVQLEVESIDQYYNAGEDIRIGVKYNGATLDENVVSFEYKNEATGKWRPMTIRSIEAEGRTMYSYIVTLEAPAVEGNVAIRARTASAISNESVVEEMPFAVAADSNDVFATHAYVTVEGTEAIDGFDMSGLTIYKKDAGDTDFVPAAVTSHGNYFDVTGLTPGFKVSFKAVYGALSTKAVEIATESNAQLPNAGMEEWSSDAGKTSYWSIDYPGADKNNLAWDTMNLLTTSQGGSGGASGCGYSAKSGTTKTDDKYSGSYAALVQTVGWGSGNTAWLNKIGSGVTGGKCQNLTVGELYLGTYNRSTNTPDYSGMLFSSRPSKVQFRAKYTPKNNADWGVAKARLIAADGSVIAQSEIKISSTAGYTLMTLDMPNAKGMKKAARIAVSFASSGNTACQAINNDNLDSPPSANVTTSKGYIGSKLYVDDIELIY